MTKRNRKRRKSRRRKQREQRQDIKPALILGAATVFALAFVFFAISYARRTQNTYLPPTDVAGHTETVPPSHILSQPMPISTFKHMLEHADGHGPPGVVISYNCKDFDCEPDLVEKLRRIAEDYPAFVYLAPFPNMSAKIAVTRRGAQIVLETFDEQRIRDFTEGR